MKTEKKPKKKVDYKAIENDPEAFEKFKKNFMKQALRKATYRWPYRNIALQEARVERGFYRCSSCEQLFGPKEIEKDHKLPVEDVKTGYVDANKYVDRLLVRTSGWAVLCTSCHLSKTQCENELRRQNGLKAINPRKKKKK